MCFVSKTKNVEAGQPKCRMDGCFSPIPRTRKARLEDMLGLKIAKRGDRLGRASIAQPVPPKRPNSPQIRGITFLNRSGSVRSSKPKSFFPARSAQLRPTRPKRAQAPRKRQTLAHPGAKKTPGTHKTPTLTLALQAKKTST